MCERENASTSVRPVFSATTGTRAVSCSTASTRRLPSSTPSIARATTCTDSSPARWPRMSANPMSAAFPSPTPRRIPSPSPAARNASAWLTPPLWATIARPPAGRSAAGRTNVAHSRRRGIEEAGGVRPEDPQARTTGHGDEGGLKPEATRARLGPSARVDDGGADPGLRALREHVGDGRGRNGNEREIDLLGDVGDPGGTGPPGHVLAAWVDGVDLPGERGQAAHQGIAGLSRRRRGADHRDRAGCEEPAERPGLCLARSACERAQPESRAARATSSGSTLEGRSSSKRSVVRIQSFPPPRPTSRSTSARGRRSASTASSRT